MRYALDHGGLVLPDTGRIALFGPEGDAPMDRLDPARCDVIHGSFPEVTAWQNRGVTVLQEPQGPYAAAIVTLPRARDLAEAHIAEAASKADLLIIDGAKTDGIESLIKAIKPRVTLLGLVSKAHGKCVWMRAGDALSDWARPQMSQIADGSWTAPGVFSADGPDPGSQLLAEALPQALKGHWADLGAGWGWLGRAALARCPKIKTLHMVEADHAALACARRNLDDTRAAFHWADATTWKAPASLDGVLMNPPFHVGRKADPSLGRAFVAAAARLVGPSGQLWMVANRHLPYENTLKDVFREVSDMGGTSKFKLFHAARPLRQRR